MLAIVIPYYKINFFEATLQSLASQTNKQFHVYIGNDASNTDPSNLLEAYKNSFLFTYKKFDNNLGGQNLVKQWERCMAMTANEDWIMILGDDDVLGAHVVDSFYKNLRFIEKEKSTVVRFATKIINQNGDEISPTFFHPKTEFATDFLLRKLKGGTRSSLSEYVFKKDKINIIKFKCFPLAWSSDTLAVVEFSENNPIFTINNTLVYFRLSGINITSQDDSIEKNKAWFQFYYYLMSKYGKQYSNELLEMLFDKIEKVQLNNKKTPVRWFKLFRLYIMFSKYSRILLLSKKVKKSII